MKKTKSLSKHDKWINDHIIIDMPDSMKKSDSINIEKVLMKKIKEELVK
jgi:hypothetical protein